MNGHRQRGVAIITAILVVALVASTAAYLAWQNQVRIRQMENLQAQAQADSVTRTAVDWARAVLAEDAARNNVDHLNEPWATVVAPLETDGGDVGGRLTDQQGLFNLNSLVRAGVASEPDIARFRRLLESLQLPGTLANGVADWVDRDSAVRYPGGAEDVDYLGMEPAYRAANQPMTEVADLYRVKGFDRLAVERLRPFVTALPDTAPVNLNTAPAQVLAAVLDNGTATDAQAIVAARPFNDRHDFAARLPEIAQRAPADVTGFNSRYFLAETRAHFGAVTVRRQALLRREGGSWPAIVWQKRY